MSAPANTSNDPFSLFEELLWHALESYGPLAALVKIGNRIKLNASKSNPWESSSTPGDFPELQIWAAGANVAPGAIPRTSDSYFWHQRYSVGISTSHLRTNVSLGINVLKWHLLRAIVRAERDLVKPAVPFVTWIKPGDFRDQLNDVSADGHDRRTSGWKGVLDLEVEFVWSTKELAA